MGIDEHDIYEQGLDPDENIWGYLKDLREYQEAAAKGDPPENRGFRTFMEFVENCVIGAKEGVILEELLNTVNLIDDLQRALKESPSVVEGRVNAIVVELRQQRTLAAKLISRLPADLPSYDPEGPPLPSGALTPRQIRARKAAAARWSQPGARRKSKDGRRLDP